MTLSQESMAQRRLRDACMSRSSPSISGAGIHESCGDISEWYLLVPIILKQPLNVVWCMLELSCQTKHNFSSSDHTAVYLNSTCHARACFSSLRNSLHGLRIRLDKNAASQLAYGNDLLDITADMW